MHQVVSLALTLAGPTRRLPHPDPVGRLVTSALESVRLHEGFQQVKVVVVALLPVGIDPPDNLPQNSAGQLPNLNPGQDGHIRQEFCIRHACSMRIIRKRDVKWEY